MVSLVDMSTEHLEDGVYIGALKVGDFDLAMRANNELYERAWYEHCKLVEERDRRLSLENIPGNRIKSIMERIKEVGRVMYGLRITGMALAEIDTNKGKEEA